MISTRIEFSSELVQESATPSGVCAPTGSQCHSNTANELKGQHVLLVEDTWLSGGKVQSAAVALKDAGAAHVTALCVARWCHYPWPDHRSMLDSLTEYYDALVCPVDGSQCAAGQGIAI
jgi:hypothetical protein